MEIKGFPNKPSASNDDLFLLQDATDSGFKNISRKDLLSNLGSGGSNPWMLKQANYSAVAGDRIIADTASGAWNLTLPTLESFGDIEILGLPSVATNNLIINGITRFENKDVLNLKLLTPYKSTKLTYLNPTIGWVENPASIITPITPFTPKSLPGLLIWVNASGTITKDANNLVSKIDDLSGNNNHLTQTTASKQPLYVANGFNNLPLIRFDNGAKYLDFPRFTNIRTVYWVIKYTESASTDAKFLLGDTSTYDFSAVNTTYYVDTQYSATQVRNGAFKKNGVTSTITNTVRDTSVATLSLVTTANDSASSFAADRNNQYGSRSWQGDLLFLAIYNAAHSASQVEQMENYLKAEYKHY